MICLTSDTLNFVFNSSGQLISMNTINFVYNLSAYAYPTGFNNFPNGFQYDLNNNLSAENLYNTTTFYYGTSIKYGNCTITGSQNVYTNNSLKYINNNVTVMGYSQTIDRRTIKPGQNTHETDTIMYTYTTLANPMYNLLAYSIYNAPTLFTDWQTSANMPATENLYVYDQTSYTPYTSSFTYTQDNQGRVATQIQTKSTGEVITTTYSYY